MTEENKETAAKIVSALEDTVEQLDPTAEWSRVQAQVFPLGYTGDETLEDLQGKALSYLISRCGEVHSPADEKALRAECERIMAGPMSGGYCICSACGERVPLRVFDQGAHDCPYKVEPMEGESFEDYKARAERIREGLKAFAFPTFPFDRERSDI